MEYIVIIAAVVIILGLIFLRRHDDTKTDYQEPHFEHSGKNWVFNGILDIDHPPLDDSPFNDYEGDLQLMVKKGFMHLDLIVDNSAKQQPPTGLFSGEALVEGDTIIVRTGHQVLGRLPQGQSTLIQAIHRQSGKSEAYGYIAHKEGKYFGEVCVRKR